MHPTQEENSGFIWNPATKDVVARIQANTFRCIEDTRRKRTDDGKFAAAALSAYALVGGEVCGTSRMSDGDRRWMFHFRTTAVTWRLYGLRSTVYAATVFSFLESRHRIDALYGALHNL